MKGKGHIQSFNEHQENLNISDVRSSKSNKPKMLFNFRISNDSSGEQRFTEDEIKNEIKSDNVFIERGLLIRKGDGKVIGEFLI
jgi:uncharacterized protein (UPF0332 family)